MPCLAAETDTAEQKTKEAGTGHVSSQVNCHEHRCHQKSLIFFFSLYFPRIPFNQNIVDSDGAVVRSVAWKDVGLVGNELGVRFEFEFFVQGNDLLGLDADLLI